VVLTVVGLLVGGAFCTRAGAHAAASYDTSAYAARLLALVNDARAQHGLRPLVLAPGTTTVAWDWTQHLADDRTLSHNGRLGRQLASHGSSRWRVYGENVGVGSVEDPDGLFEAYMHSPEHRANILNPDYRFVGLAVVFTGSRSWNTFDFVDVYGSAAPVHRAGRGHVRSAHTGAAPAKPAPRPAVVSPRRVATRQDVVWVEGLQHRAHPARTRTRPRPVTPHAPVVIAAGPSVGGGAGPVVAAAFPRPVDRHQPAVLAVAVLALMFVARRWMLTAVRRLA
jgi:hypothetical protein